MALLALVTAVRASIQAKRAEKRADEALDLSRRQNTRAELEHFWRTHDRASDQAKAAVEKRAAELKRLAVTEETGLTLDDDLDQAAFELLESRGEAYTDEGGRRWLGSGVPFFDITTAGHFGGRRNR